MKISRSEKRIGLRKRVAGVGSSFFGNSDDTQNQSIKVVRQEQAFPYHHMKTSTHEGRGKKTKKLPLKQSANEQNVFSAELQSSRSLKWEMGSFSII